MNSMVSKLNNDQLSGLANLCFDIAKAAFVLALLPTQTDSANLILLITKITAGLLMGLVFTISALVLLKSRKR